MVLSHSWEIYHESLSRMRVLGAGVVVVTARPQVVSIVDNRTGEEWRQTGLRREGTLWIATVENLTTGQVIAWGASSPKFALYDALVKCGCPRDAATKAAKTAGWG